MAVWLRDSGIGTLPGAMDVYYSFYDSTYSTWSSPMNLYQNQYIDSSPAAAFNSDGEPMVIWTREYDLPGANPFEGQS